MIQDPATAGVVHYFFEWAALAAGAFAFRRIRRSSSGGMLSSGNFPLVIGCILGAGIGNKLVFWLEYPHLWELFKDKPLSWAMGQSIVGGLLGGWIGVELAKKLARISTRSGDDFILPILTGIVVGRIGCFLAGLNDGTYGLPTTLPWGIDFGDGVSRHPTQLYEWGLALAAMLTYPRWRLAFAHEAGLAFRAFMAGYLLWRLLIDALKPVPFAYPLGLSGIQWVCLLWLAGMLGARLLHLRRTAAKNSATTLKATTP